MFIQVFGDLKKGHCLPPMGMTVLSCTMFGILFLIQGLHLTDLQSGPEEGSQDAVGSGNLCRVTEVIKDV